MVGATKLLRGVRCHRVAIQNLGTVAAGKHRLTATADRLAAFGSPKRLKLTPAD